jgi:hypothetical protein
MPEGRVADGEEDPELTVAQQGDESTHFTIASDGAAGDRNASHANHPNRRPRCPGLRWAASPRGQQLSQYLPTGSSRHLPTGKGR